MKFLKSILAVSWILLLSIICVVLSPAFFLLWSIVNRKDISLWLSFPLALMNAIVYVQLFIFFKEFQPTIDLMHNPAIYYGICLIAPFLVTRLSSLRSSPLKNKQRYLLSIVFFILLLISSLTLVALVHYLSHKRHFLTYLFTTEIILFLWVSLVTFLFIKHPEDMFLKKIQWYGSVLSEWVGRNDEHK